MELYVVLNSRHVLCVTTEYLVVFMLPLLLAGINAKRPLLFCVLKWQTEGTELENPVSLAACESSGETAVM